MRSRFHKASTNWPYNSRAALGSPPGADSHRCRQALPVRRAIRRAPKSPRPARSHAAVDESLDVPCVG